MLRALGLAVVALGSMLLVAPGALAQQGQGEGMGTILDQLNRSINPDRPRDDPRLPRDDRYARDRAYEGSSGPGDRRDSGFARFSDRDLRAEYDRLDNEQRRLQRVQRDIADELERRGIRR